MARRTAKAPVEEQRQFALNDDTTVLDVVELYENNPDADVLLISVSEYHGRKGLDIRRCYKDEAGVFRPTKHGFRIGRDCAKRLRTALVENASAIDEQLT